MQITRDNYWQNHEKIQKDIAKAGYLPEVFADKNWKLLDSEAECDWADWDYDGFDKQKEAITHLLDLINKFYAGDKDDAKPKKKARGKKPEKQPEKQPEETPEEEPEDEPDEEPEQEPEDEPDEEPEQDPEEDPEQEPDDDPEEEPEKKPKKKAPKAKPSTQTKEVDELTPEVDVIQQYVKIHGKRRDDAYDHALSLLRKLQKLINTRAIRASSPYADEINAIQAHLLKIIKTQNLEVVDIDDLQHYADIASSERVSRVTQWVKTFIANFEHRRPDLVKAKKFLAKAPDEPELQDARSALADYIEGKTNQVALTESQLSGLMGIL
ncbi:MAG: hypothetical protein ACI35Q_08435 [Marinilabiliaceae bacterium]